MYLIYFEKMRHDEDDKTYNIKRSYKKWLIVIYLTRRKNNSVLSIQTTLFFCSYNFHNTEKT